MIGRSETDAQIEGPGRFMNQMSSLRCDPIELALEAPFRLASLQVNPATLELQRGGDLWTVEPRVMKVLVALNRSRGHPVRRDDLVDLCWEGRIVGEDSLNRGISQLRKALAPEPGAAIDTIPRVGYRLRVDVEEENFSSATPHAPASGSRRRRSWLILAFFALGLVAIAIWWLLSSPREWRAAELRPLTRETGVEDHPALSPDGQRLLYAAGPGFGAPRDLFLRGTRLGDDLPIPVTRTAADEFAPAWSPSGNRIAFIRREASGDCYLVVMAPPSGAERAVGRCGLAPYGLAWRGEEELLFGDRSADGLPRRLMAMNVITGIARPITSPPPDSIGDAAPAVSADGRYVIFRRTAALGSDDLFLLDLRTGEDRPVTQHGWKAAGFAWGADNILFFSGNRGGDFGLWSIDPGRADAPKRVSLGTVPFGRLSADRSGRRIAVEAIRRRTSLALVTPEGMRSLTSGNGVDLDPDVAPDGTIAFTSDRGGTNELWSRSPSGRIVRLTEMGASFVYSPRWSPDGRQIVFLAVVNGQTDIYRIRADGSGLARVTRDGRRKGRVAWGPRSGDLVFTVARPEGWVMMRKAEGSGAAIPIAGTEGIAVIESGGGRLFGRRIADPELVALDPRSGSRLRTRGLEGWAVTANGVLEVGRESEALRDSLWLLPWSGTPRQIATFQAPERANPAIGPDGSIIISQAVEDEADILLISLER